MSAAAAEADHTEVPHRGLITLSIMLATIMQVLDTTIANVALPSMTGDLGASPDTITWVLTSYIVAAAIVTPMTGYLSDRIGRKQVFMISVVGFVVTSMACGLSWNLNTMVTFRILQGLFGAAIVPLSQTFLLDINPRERHGSAMAMWGAGIMIGPIIGPTLGGWLTESFNWRWVFFINVPVGALALAGCMAFLPGSEKRARRFDFFGFAMLTLGIGALQLMLDRGGEVEWFASGEIWIEFILAITGFWVFGVHIMTAEHPFIDPRIFTDRNFVVGLVFIFVIGIVLLASLALLPPMLSRIFGLPVVTTGIVMAPRGMGTMVSMLLVGRLVRMVDARALVMAGLCLTIVSLYMMTGFSPDMDNTPIIVTGVIQGLGLGLVFVPLSTVAFATLAPMYRADAASLFSLVRNIGSSIGISAVTVMLSRNVQINHVELGGAITPYSSAVRGLGDMTQQLLAQLDGLVNIQALMISYIDDFKLMMVVTICAVPLVLMLSKPKQAPRPQAHPPAAAD